VRWEHPAKSLPLRRSRLLDLYLVPSTHLVRDFT